MNILNIQEVATWGLGPAVLGVPAQAGRMRCPPAVHPKAVQRAPGPGLRPVTYWLYEPSQAGPSLSLTYKRLYLIMLGSCGPVRHLGRIQHLESTPEGGWPVSGMF